MKISTLAGLASGLFVASAISAHAVVVPPSMSMTVAAADCDPSNSSVVGFGLVCGDAPDATGNDRTDSGNVNLGAADGAFYSLGLDANGGLYGGIIIMEISPAFTGPAMIVEVTNPSNHWEAARVYVSNDGVGFMDVGLVTNGKGGSEAAINTVSINGVWNYLALQDESVATYGASGSVDGFDLDAITVAPVPVPAGALLLGTALAGFGLTRRKA